MDELPSTIQDDLKLFNTLVDFLLKEEKDNPVAERIHRKDLHKAVDYSLSNEASLDQDLLQNLKDLVRATPKTATELFFNQLFGGRQGKAVVGDLLAVLLNNSMYTYKVAGPLVAIEKEIIHQSCKLVGFDSNGDGTIAPGGSMSNYMALLMARDKAQPDARFEGVNQPLVMYTSNESHYSNAKNASFAGIGRNNVRYIEANDHGQMRPDRLEEQIKEDIANGFKPFYVNATAGTTVLGAFDPVNDIADITEAYNLWLHVDGAYCGAVIFSEKYRHVVDGAHRADSFSYNAHKMLGTPLTCSLILVKDKRYLTHSFSNEAEYLYQTDDDADNLGKTSLQCGRRNDALKFWTLWKSIGLKGLEQMVDKQFALSSYAKAYVDGHPDYQVYSYDDSVSICFNYKGIDAASLCTALYEEQETVVGFGIFNEDKFIRLVTINPNNSEKDLDRFFNVIETFVSRTPKLQEIKVASE